MADKELESKLMNLTPPMENTLPMGEQMENKKIYEKQVDTLCIQADESIRESNFEDGLSKLMEAYEIVTGHPWAIKQQQIYDLIQNGRYKQQDHIKKTQLRMQQHHESQAAEEQQKMLVQAHKQELEKEKLEKEHKLKQLQEWKQREEEISTKAFKLLEDGEKLLKNQQFDDLIAQYSEAKRLFLEIKWDGEAQKVEDSIQEFRKQRGKIAQKLEAEKIAREEQIGTWKTKEQEFQVQQEQHQHTEEEKKRKFQQSISRKEIETQVYGYLDKANTYEKSGDLSNAIQVYENAKDAMGRLGWTQEIIKITDSIKLLQKRLREEQEKQKQEKLSQRFKEQETKELNRRIEEQEQERKKLEDEKQRKIQEFQQLKQREKEVSEHAFQQIEEIEKLVKKYKEHVGADKYLMECPFSQAKKIYQNSRDLLLSLGWKAEADKLSSAISMYEQLYTKDQNERILISKRREKEQEEQRKLEASIHMQHQEQERREQERLQKLHDLDIKKEQEAEISQKVFAQIEEIEKQVKYYKENVLANKYELECPYRKAKEIYMRSREQLLGISWKKEADKLLSSIEMYDELYKKDLLEREKLRVRQQKEEDEKRQLQESVRLQKEIQEKKEQERKEKLLQLDKMKEQELEISERVFREIDEIEKVVKNYKENAIIKNYTIDCPYLEARNVYQNSRKLLLKLGWKEQADKLLSSISMYESLHLNDQKERATLLLINKTKEIEQKKIEETIQIQQQEKDRLERERIQKLQEQGKRKEYETEISKRAFARIEEIEKEVKYYKEHAAAENFAIHCPYMQAMEVYKVSLEDLLSIGWKKEADKLSTSISMYENLYKKDLSEREKQELIKRKQMEDEKKIEESIRLQKEERDRQEQERIQTLQEQGKRKEYETEISKRAFARIEEIEKEVKYYKEHAATENFELMCPYLKAKEIYLTSREKLLSIGWKEEADKLLTSISMYENLYKKDLSEREKQEFLKKKQREDDKKLEESVRLQKEERDKQEQERIQKLREQGKKKEYEDQISKRAFARIEEIEKEVKYYKEHAAAENFAISCPYMRAMEVYRISLEDLLSIGWKKEADKLSTSISMYENLYKKDLSEREKQELLKKKQQEDEKQLEESIRLQKEERERQEHEYLKVLQEQDRKRQLETEISQQAFKKIEEIEKVVRYYKEHVVAEQFSLECPYLQAIEFYKEAREMLLEIDWVKEADKLLISISMYEKLAELDEKEREQFLKKRLKQEEDRVKLEEEIRVQKDEQEKQERERLRTLRDQNKRKQYESEISEEAFHIIEDIEKEVTIYNERVKIENYNLSCPYQRAKEIYQQARDMLLEIGWKKEADKLAHSISLYTKLEKEDLEVRDKFRKRLEKERKEEFELQETIRKERERLALEEEKKESEKVQRDLKRQENEELQQVAYKKLEEGNSFIQEKDFESATERLNDALNIFKKIKWKNGVKLTEDAIKYKENEREKFENLLKHEQLALQEQKKKEREFQEFLEEQRRIKEQEEQNRKLELLRMDMTSREINEKQETAFKKLEDGNELVKIREFKKANGLFLEALSIFQEIEWVDGVERTKQAISHNLIEQERYNQQIEYQKKLEQEKQKEQQELRELMRKRQEMTQLEEQKKRLHLEQQNELAERINKRQQEAMVLLEQGNVKTTQNEFETAENLFAQALQIFQEIQWAHGIKITEEVIKHNKEEKNRFSLKQKKDEQTRLEQLKQQKELEQMLLQQKLVAQQEAQLKEKQQQHQTEKLQQIQSMESEAMQYLENGNQAIRDKQFDHANTLFIAAMKIFQEMGWEKGIEMTNNALDYNQKEMLKFENERLREQQKIKEAKIRQEEINQLIQESKEEEIKKELEWKQKLEEKTQQLDVENQIKNQIFTLLEQGSKLAAKNEYLSAIDLYKKTISLFEKINWSLKRDQVIDLIDSTQQDYENYRTLLAKEEALRKKQIQEEEELQNIIKTEQEKEAERLKAIQQQQMQQIEQDKLKEELRREAADEIHKASVMLERRKFENALESLAIALKNFNKLGWTREAQATEEQIAEVKNQQREAYKPVDREQSASNVEISEQGYKEIEEADKLIRQKEFQKALPRLEEAKRLFEKIQWTKAIKMVELRMRETERLHKEKQEMIEKLRARKSRKTEKEAYTLLEKADKYRRETHYDYALVLVQEAQKIFQDLGWDREETEVNSLINIITKEIADQQKTRSQEKEVRSVKIKVEEDEERRIQEIIEERRRRRRGEREELKKD